MNWLWWILLWVSSQALSGLYGFDPFNNFNYIDPTNAQFTEINNPLPQQLQQFQGVSALDSGKGIFYLLVSDLDYLYLYGFNLANGTVVSNVTLPLEPSGGIGNAMAFDPTTGLCLVMGWLPLAPHSNHSLLAVNATTGQYQEVAILVSDTTIVSSPSTFDWKTRQFITLFGNPTTGVPAFFLAHVDTGLVKMIPMIQQFQTLAYNDQDGYVYGFGISQNIRTVLRFDTTTFSSQLVGQLNNYFVVYGALSALNSKDRILYGLLQPANGGQYQLLGINLDNAVIISSPLACNGLYLSKTRRTMNMSVLRSELPVSLDLPWCLFQLQFS